MRAGYYTYGFEMVPIEQSLPHIARCGFDGIELCTLPGYSTALETLDKERVQQIRRLLDEHGLELAAIGAHTTLMASDPDANAANLARLHGNIDLAATMGAPVVDTFSGAAPKDWSEEQAWETLAERTAALAAYAAERGVQIGFEHHLDMVVADPDQMLRLLKMVPNPALKVNLDISHDAALGLSIPEVVRKLAPYTVHTHFKDLTGRYPDTYRWLIPGEGEFDLTGFVRALAKNGYQGFVTAEIGIMRRKNRADYNPFTAAEMSADALKRAFAEAGVSA